MEIKDGYIEVDKKKYQILKHVDNGYKVKDEQNKEYYALEYGWQGYYYKNEKAYEKGDETCYIPEYNTLDEEKTQYILLVDEENEAKYFKKDFVKIAKSALEECMDFFKKEIPQKLIDEIAAIAFDVVDWQHPESYLQECELEDYIIEYFKNNKKDIKKYASNSLKQELKEMLEGEISNSEFKRIFDNSDETIALRNGYGFFPIKIGKLDFYDKLILTDDKVKFCEKELDVYIAKNICEESQIDDFFGNSMGYDIREYIVGGYEDIETEKM